MQYIYQFVKMDVNFDAIFAGSAFYASKEKVEEVIEEDCEFILKYGANVEVEDYKLHPWQECKMQDGSRKCITILKVVRGYEKNKVYFGYVKHRLY